MFLEESVHLSLACVFVEQHFKELHVVSKAVTIPLYCEPIIIVSAISRCIVVLAFSTGVLAFQSRSDLSTSVFEPDENSKIGVVFEHAIVVFIDNLLNLIE